jgi:hydrogenase nickel incorporation protein HypA/HybF
MHEWALAEAVLAAASETADKEGLKRVSEVKMRIGELQGIELEILDFAFSQLKKGKFKKAKFTMRTAEATFKCRACGNTWIFNKDGVDEAAAEAIHFVPEVAHTYLKCPKCGSPDFEITEGRGVWLESIKGER